MRSCLAEPVDTELTPALPSSPQPPSRAIIPFGRGWCYLRTAPAENEDGNPILAGPGCSQRLWLQSQHHNLVCSTRGTSSAQSHKTLDPAAAPHISIWQHREREQQILLETWHCPRPAQPVLPAPPGARDEVPAKPSQCPGAPHFPGPTGTPC